MRTAFLLLSLTLASAGAAAAQEEGELAQALALQKVMQRTIAQVDPSIACVLVSRSDLYVRQAGAPPGKLGGYDPKDPRRIARTVENTDTISLDEKLDLANVNNVPHSFGSGVVIDAAGLILTNYHVVHDATKVYVRLPGGKGSYADIHAADGRSDLAVLKLLDARLLPLSPIALGDGDGVERGQFVLSIANPYAVGLRDGQPSASWGIVSNVRRRAAAPSMLETERVKPLHHYGFLLQLDARLNLGCSGGAVVDLQGKLVGLTTSFAAIQGGETPGGYAIPLTSGLRRIVETLRKGEEVEYGFLGVAPEPNPEGRGVLIGYCTPGSPAEREGRLTSKDIITRINGKPMLEPEDLFLALGSQLAGSTIQVHVRRGGQPTVDTTEVRLAKLPVPGKQIASSLGSRPFVRGLRVDYTSTLLGQNPSNAIPSGVVIAEVQPGSSAAAAQLKAGEVITHVNSRKVASPAHFYALLRDQQTPAELVLMPFSAKDAPPVVTLK